MADLPEVNSLIYITVKDGTNFRSRVEDMDGPLMTVGAPIGAGDLDIPDDGSELEVFWTGIRARYVMPVRMIGRTKTRPARWHLLSIGEPVRQTRRSYVRGGGGGSVDILAVASQPSVGPTEAGIIDISEAGLRCRVDKQELVRGELLVVRLELPTRTMEIQGTVVSTREGEGGPNSDVVVTYRLKEPDAQAIRRYVFQWEVAERRRQLGLG